MLGMVFYLLCNVAQISGTDPQGFCIIRQFHQESVLDYI
ncbi:hypothetical protein NSP_38670 [Nodularia spumigena CCY9414]|nr:hypothetical protein NSP_38670 [Nodularia spumigena CCY9414]